MGQAFPQVVISEKFIFLSPGKNRGFSKARNVYEDALLITTNNDQNQQNDEHFRTETT